MFTTEVMEFDGKNSVESGMVSVEYALGTCAAGGLAGVLATLLKSDWIQNLLKAIFEKVLSALF